MNQYWVDLPEGDFTTRLLLVRFDYSFTPLITLANFVQYDTQSDNIGLQSDPEAGQRDLPCVEPLLEEEPPGGQVHLGYDRRALQDQLHVPILRASGRGFVKIG